MRRPSVLALALWAAALAAVIAALIFLPRTRESWEHWQTEAAATPTPTANISSMLADPSSAVKPVSTVLALKNGSKGDTVKAVQQKLKDLGYYQGYVDGAFGAGTADAVLLFQQQNGLEADGVVGPTTYTRLFSGGASTCAPTAAPTPTPTAEPSSAVLKKGANGESVRQLQQRLKDLGYYSGKVDGDFGNATLESVKQFQRANGLQADGVAGTTTTALLYSDSAAAFSEAAAKGSEDFLVLVNRTHTVGEDYNPGTMVVLNNRVSSSLAKVNKSGMEGNPTAVDALITMLTAAKEAGLGKWQINAAYRTYAYQKKLFDNSVKEYMNKGYSRSKAQSATRQTIADPGTSEHHTGLAFDLAVSGSSQFAGTDQQKWLAKHCWEYGFVIRYEKEKEAITGYIAECWHIRYVGLPDSMTMYQKNLCLEEYLGVTD